MACKYNLTTSCWKVQLKVFWLSLKAHFISIFPTEVVIFWLIFCTLHCTCVWRPANTACLRPYVMWCWHVIVNRRSTDGYDYNKLYGPPPPAEQIVRTSPLKKAFIDQDLWRQGHTQTGTKKVFMKSGKLRPHEW